MKKYYIITLILFAFILTSFLKKDSPYQLTRIPPGTMKIDSNLFMDKTEITNFMWLEYYYWIERVYGKDSEKAKSCLPNEELWLKEDSCLHSFYYYNLRHPAYRDYPIIGITQEQAIDFCQWRSDRVFEILLIENDILEHTPNQDEKNYFSIENYFKGNYFDKKPNINFIYVPNYRLPTEHEWKKANNFFKVYAKANLKICKKKYCYNLYTNDSLEKNYNVTPCIGDSLTKDPFKPVECRKNKNIGFHFHGNASEWLHKKNMAIGGNWKDTTDAYFDIPIEANEPSTTIGFRAICEWKEYKIVN